MNLHIEFDNGDITGKGRSIREEDVLIFNVKYKPFEVGEKVTFIERDQRTFLPSHTYSGEIVEILEVEGTSRRKAIHNDKIIKIRYKENDQQNSIEIT